MESYNITPRESIRCYIRLYAVFLENAVRTDVRTIPLVTAETFGERLARLRSEKGMRPTDLAHRVGMTEGAIRHLESGHTKQPSLSVGIKIAKALDVTPEYLAFGTGPIRLAEVTRLPGIPFEGELPEDRVAGLESHMLAALEEVRAEVRRALERQDAAFSSVESALGNLDNRLGVTEARLGLAPPATGEGK